MTEDSQGDQALPIRAVFTGPREWVIEGFRLAHARFTEEAAKDVAGTEAPAKAAFIPLFEALNWAATLIENLRDEDGVEITPTMQGIRFARNQVHHAWANALEMKFVDVQSVAGPVTISGKSFDGWYWRPITNLPDPPERQPDRLGQQAYRQRLEGRPAAEALEELEELLARLV